ncbi:hypothetical protein GF412_04010 [Candidatus Micrarchaeota archaeon]|nr:hypothetical protein [Candidatus Micrarchaeota archaeon]MBD3418114.1 hypothetical protein [Candidatus Micrarchaeota archaeon]
MAQKQKTKPSTPKEWIQKGNRIHRQIHALKKEGGNRKKIARLRPKRYNAYLEAVRAGASIEDIPFKDAQKYVMEHIGERVAKAKPKKQEPTEFKRPAQEHKPKKYKMVFTTEEVYGKKEARRLARQDRRYKRMLARMSPKQKERYFKKMDENIRKAGLTETAVSESKGIAMPEKGMRSSEAQKYVRSWLGEVPEYQEHKRKASEHLTSATRASKIARVLYRPTEHKEEVMESLDELFFHKHRSIEERREMEKIMEAKKAEFEKEHASKPELIRAYSRELDEFKQKRAEDVAFPFSEKEQKIMAETGFDYHKRIKSKKARLRAEENVKGKTRLQRELKEKLLKEAEELLEDLEEPTEKEKKEIENIRKAAGSEDVEYSEMLALALGEDDEEILEAVELALVAQTVDELKTRVASAEKKKPVKVARAERKGKG